MPQLGERIAESLTNDPTIRYDNRRPLFMRTTTWSLNQDNSSDSSLESELVRQKNSSLSKVVPAIELTLGDVETPAAISSSKHVCETSAVRKVLSASNSLATSEEEVIVKNIPVENSSVCVRNQPTVRSNEQHVTCPALFTSVGDRGETGERFEQSTSGKQNCQTDHVSRKRGHSLNEVTSNVNSDLFNLALQVNQQKQLEHCALKNQQISAGQEEQKHLYSSILLQQQIQQQQQQHQNWQQHKQQAECQTSQQQTHQQKQPQQQQQQQQQQAKQQTQERQRQEQHKHHSSNLHQDSSLGLHTAIAKNKTPACERFARHIERMEYGNRMKHMSLGHSLWPHSSKFVPVGRRPRSATGRPKIESTVCHGVPSGRANGVAKKRPIHTDDLKSSLTDLILCRQGIHSRFSKPAGSLRCLEKVGITDHWDCKQRNISEVCSLDYHDDLPSIVGSMKLDETKTSASRMTNTKEARPGLFTTCPSTYASQNLACWDLASHEKAVQTDYPIRMKRTNRPRTSLSFMHSISPFRKSDRLPSPTPYHYPLYRYEYYSMFNKCPTKSSRSISHKRTADHSIHRYRPIVSQLYLSPYQQNIESSGAVSRRGQRKLNPKKQRKWMD